MSTEERALMIDLAKRLRVAVELVAGEYHPSPGAVKARSGQDNTQTTVYSTAMPVAPISVGCVGSRQSEGGAEMNMNEYQTAARTTAFYPLPIIYPALKLAGEAGEVAEKVGKLIRDKGLLTSVGEGTYGLGNPSNEDTAALVKELGDVLWYIAALAGDLGVGLEDVGKVNIEKLASRAQRDVLSGSGDNR